MLYFILLLVGYFIVKTIISTQQDKQVLREIPIEKKFEVIVNAVNEVAFSGNGKIKKIDWQSFFLGELGSNQIIEFTYAHKTLTVVWKYKYFQKEVAYEKRIQNANNLSIFEQQKFVENLIIEMSNTIARHKREVLKPISNPFAERLKEIDNKILDIVKMDEEIQEMVDKPKPKLNTLFVGTVKKFRPNENNDKYIINVVAGIAPNRRVISEDEAIAGGLFLGKSYLINCIEKDIQHYEEREFEFKASKELTAYDVISAVAKLGEAKIINVD